MVPPFIIPTKPPRAYGYGRSPEKSSIDTSPVEWDLEIVPLFDPMKPPTDTLSISLETFLTDTSPVE